MVRTHKPMLTNRPLSNIRSALPAPFPLGRVARFLGESERVHFLLPPPFQTVLAPPSDARCVDKGLRTRRGVLRIGCVRKQITLPYPTKHISKCPAAATQSMRWESSALGSAPPAARPGFERHSLLLIIIPIAVSDSVVALSKSSWGGPASDASAS